MSETASRFGIVLVTAGTELEARTIAQNLVQANLAACVNFYPVQSIYTWQGKVQQDPEWQLVIKTDLQRFDELTSTIQAIHSYKVPEIIALPLQTGEPTYLDWMATQTAATSAS
ncbi:MAG: divalent-cation tolerance protein CutA [Cyanobacteria bacterium J06638_22]